MLPFSKYAFDFTKPTFKILRPATYERNDTIGWEIFISIYDIVALPKSNWFILYHGVNKLVARGLNPACRIVQSGPQLDSKINIKK